MSYDFSTWPQKIVDPSSMRLEKPRRSGITMVIDKGLGYNGFFDLLESAWMHIDYIKFGFGTSVLYPNKLLEAKIELAKHYQVKIFPGGTLLEIAFQQKEIDSYLHAVKKLGFTAIEISDGTISYSKESRSELIKRAKNFSLEVITECGKKQAGLPFDFEELAHTLSADIEAGASFVIVEGRESGSGVGIYDENGNFDSEKILQLVKEWPHRDLLLWEAPQKKQQAEFITHFGPNVNLGNIPAGDVLALEALRRGLRSDTFYHNPSVKLGLQK